MSDGLTAIAQLIEPVQRTVVADPGLWHALDPHRGSLSSRAATALDRLVQSQIEPTLQTLAGLNAPAHAKRLAADALKDQADGMHTLARAVRSDDPRTAIRLSRQATDRLEAAVQKLRAAGLPQIGGA